MDLQAETWHGYTYGIVYVPVNSSFNLLHYVKCLYASRVRSKTDKKRKKEKKRTAKKNLPYGEIQTRIFRTGKQHFSPLQVVPKVRPSTL